MKSNICVVVSLKMIPLFPKKYSQLILELVIRSVNFSCSTEWFPFNSNL